MKLSKLSYAVVVASLMAAGAAQAAVKTSGSVALTSDYLFRGISQSAENMAVQGSMTLAHDSGVYFTAWGSSISQEATLQGSSSGLELDTLLGYAGASGDVSYDVGVMRYNYPGADKNVPESSYNEVYASATYKGVKLGAAYSDDYFAETGEFVYVYADYGVALTDKVNLVTHVGWNKFSDTGAGSFLAAAGDSDAYFDYKVGLNTTVEGIGLEVAYIGADSIAEAAYGEGAEGRAVFTASKSF